MTDTELSKITRIPLSTINSYKKSNNDKTLLYFVLKNIPNLGEIYDRVIDERQLKIYSRTDLENDLYKKISNMAEYTNYTFSKGIVGDSSMYDFYATNNDKIVVFDVRPTLVYGKKFEDLIKKIYSSISEEYSHVEICFLTLYPKERYTFKYNVTIKSIGDILSVPDEKLIII
jgi:hypothetical protein